jgi:hypothetical protein
MKEGPHSPRRREEERKGKERRKDEFLHEF